MRLLSYIALRCVARAICGLYRCCCSASVAAAERRARLHQAVSFYQTLGTSLAITTLFWAFVLLAAASGAARHDYSDGIRVGADFILGAVAALGLGFFTAFVSQNSARYSQLPAQAAIRGRGEGRQLADSQHAPAPDADSRTACPQGYRARSVQPPRRGRHAHRDEVCGADRRAGSDRRHSWCCAVLCHHVPADGAQSEQCQLDLPRLQLRCGAKPRSRFPDPNLRLRGRPCAANNSSQSLTCARAAGAGNLCATAFGAESIAGFAAGFSLVTLAVRLFAGARAPPSRATSARAACESVRFAVQRGSADKVCAAQACCTSARRSQTGSSRR